MKVRIYPTDAQRTFLNKTLGCCRLIYNLMLDDRIIMYNFLKDDPELLHAFRYKTEKEYKAEYDFLKEVDAFALQQSRRNLESAYKNFFDSLTGKRKGEKMGFPRFKAKKEYHDSYRTGMSIKADLDKQTIKLPKIHDPVKFKHRFNIKSWYRYATLKNITISRSASGKYYASLLHEGEQDYIGYSQSHDKIVGCDMSLAKCYVDSSGYSPGYGREYRKIEEKLALLQRRLSRKTKGSRNWEKLRVRIARLHERVANIRRELQERESLRLVKEYDVVVIEDLSIKGMSRSLKLGKSVMDVGWGTFVGMLKYKALWHDKMVLVADKWYPSSKTCHVCGWIKEDLTLRDREWVCPECGTEHDRDENAARNLRGYGKRVLLQRQELTPMDMGALAAL
ncbi:transposase [Spirochaetia bacterium]|nr:transposase [Spirochaetia bacterium]